MEGSDLMVALPWIIFGICLLVLCIRLLRARHPSGDRTQRSPPADPPDD
jgi:hypothetical protein